MKAHCDTCGTALDPKTSIERTWDGELFLFCGEACARGGGHLANDIYVDDDGNGTGPLAPGELDEARPQERRRNRERP